ncbi:hypothetical protein Tco_1334387, partial [Tanacetum coccineum]
MEKPFSKFKNDKGYPNKNHVRKFLCALPLKWRLKVTTIEEAKDLAKLPLEDLIGNLNVKSLALKAKVTKGQTSNDSVCQDGSDEYEDEEKEFNSMMKILWKFFKKGKRFGRENRFDNGGN